MIPRIIFSARNNLIHIPSRPAPPSAKTRTAICLIQHQDQPHQRRWAQVHDVRFLATTQASRNAADRYRDKLERKAREKGLDGDVDKLMVMAGRERIEAEAKEDELARQNGMSDSSGSSRVHGSPGSTGADTTDAEELRAQQHRPTQTQQQQQQAAAVGATSPAAPANPTNPSIKPLSSILDLPKARQLPLAELSAIWRIHHAASPLSLSAVIPLPTYLEMTRVARLHSPTFVLPVPRPGAGAEMHFLQWMFAEPSAEAEARALAAAGESASTVLFTQLAEYKVRGEWALPHTSLTHYVDLGLLGGKGAVLMVGQVVEGRGASTQDAQWLVSLMQRFYGPMGLEGSGAKRGLVEQFGRGDAGFSVDRLLEESEKLDVGI